MTERERWAIVVMALSALLWDCPVREREDIESTLEWAEQQRCNQSEE